MLIGVFAHSLPSLQEQRGRPYYDAQPEFPEQRENLKTLALALDFPAARPPPVDLLQRIASPGTEIFVQIRETSHLCLASDRFPMAKSI